MDLNNLSSNWKKLQQSLGPSSTPKKNTPAPNPKKRKMGSYMSSSQPISNKHPKLPTTSTPSNQPTASTTTTNAPTSTPTPSTTPTATIGKYLSLDCEMVGTTSITPLAIPAHNRQTHPNTPPEFSILARATLVNYNSETVYDAYVLPPRGVSISNYRTQWSGITAQNLVPGNAKTRPKTFEVVQAEVAKLLEGRVLVGHALRNDLAVLGLSHPKRDIRDTSRHPKFRAMTAAGEGRNGKPGRVRTPSLKKLALDVLRLEIQGGETAEGGARGLGHSSVEDAGVAMMLFRREKKEFEEENVKVFGRRGAGAVTKGSVAANGSKNEVMRGAPKELNGVSSGAVDSGYISEDSDDDEAEDEVEEDEVDGEANAANADKTASRQGKKKKKKKSRTKR